MREAFRFPGRPSPRRRIPRALEIALCGLCGIVALPGVALVAAAGRLRGRGPVLLRERCVGEGGDEFELLRLRATRIHRIPQLWNVIRGEMTLLGPRPQDPALVAERELLIPFYDRRDLHRPGITKFPRLSRSLPN